MKTITVINNLLNGTITTKVCRVCLEEAEYLADYDEPQTFLGDFYSKSHKLEEVIAELTKNTSRRFEIDFSMKICESCVGNAVSAFLFIKQYEVATHSLISCVEHLHSHVEKIATDMVSMRDESIVFVMPYKNMYDFIEHNNVLKAYEKELASNLIIKREYVPDNKYKIKDVEIEVSNKNELILKEKNDNIVNKAELFNEGNIYNENFAEGHQKFECIICKLKISTRCELNLHERWHKNSGHYSCKLCKTVLSSLDALEMHTLLHKERTKDYLCTECGKSFYNEHLLKAHLRFHGEKKYNCDTCDKSFQTNTLLSKHKRLKHERKTLLSICDLCGKMCSSNDRLRIHRECHVTKICPHCGKNLFYKRTYKQHVLRCSGIQSQPEAIYECDYCGGTWKSKQQLRIHIFGKHMYYKPFTCDICGKGFSTKNLLRGHSIVHTRERLWVCDICSNRFVDKKALRVHRRLHTGEKPYECDVCGERFICPTRRIMHIRRKHMERSLACNICGLRFYTNSNLTSHIKKVHNNLEKEKTEFSGGETNDLNNVNNFKL